MKARRFALLGNLLLSGLLAACVWVLLVWVASRPALKVLFDLTPQRVNSVDPATEDLLRDLRAREAEVQFHLLGEVPPGYAAEDDVRQGLAIRRQLFDLTRTLLLRYQALGGDAVTIVDHDFYREPQAAREAVQRFDYKAEENEVVVVAVRLPGKEWRHRKLSLVSDLARIELPSTPGGPMRAAPLPVLKDYKGEAGISSAMKSLLVTGTPVAYVLRGYSPDLDLSVDSPRGYGVLLAALARSGFDVRDFDLRGQSTVPADAAVVLLLEPRNELPDRDAQLLFDYVQRGGRVFVNYSWAGLGDWNPSGGRFGELLGYRVGSQPVFHLIPSPRTGARGLDGNEGVAKLQVQYSVHHPVTKRWAEQRRPLEVAAARPVLEPAGAPAGVRREAILATGEQAWLAVPDAYGQPDLRAPQQLSRFVVGLACTVDPAEGADRSGEVVIVSGVICNNVGMRASFGDFVVNVCNWMADRKVLIDIEGSRYEARYLDPGPEQLERMHSLLVLQVPAVFLAVGLFVVWLRRRQ